MTEDTTLTAQWEDESKLVKPTKIALERSEIYVPEWHEFHINYGVAPVSYTHLDVYKRQMIRPPPCTLKMIGSSLSGDSEGRNTSNRCASF